MYAALNNLPHATHAYSAMVVGNTAGGCLAQYRQQLKSLQLAAVCRLSFNVVTEASAEAALFHVQLLLPVAQQQQPDGPDVPPPLWGSAHAMHQQHSFSKS
jgi:hypothetical protein